MRNKSLKITAVALIVAILAMMMAGCGAPTISKPQMSEGAQSVKVEGSCDIAINGDVITVSGETNLMDGVVLDISIVSQDGMTVDNVRVTKNGDQVSQDFAITSEKFDETVKSVTGFIACAPSQYGQHANQDTVFDKYGKKFENIEADKENLVWNAGGNVVLFASQSIDIPQ